MDGSSLAIIIPSVMAVLSALVAVYAVVVKGNTKVKVDDATLIRSNLIPTSVWLEQQAKRDEEIRLLNEKIDKQRSDYEARLDLKDQHIEKISTEFRQEIRVRDEQIESLKDEVKELRHQVKNVQAVQKTEADVRKIERETPH